MKVQNWKILVLTILVGGALLVFAFTDLFGGNTPALLGLLLALYIVNKGTYIAFCRPGRERASEQASREKQLYREHFGALAPAVCFLHYIIAALDWLMIHFMTKTPAVCGMGAALLIAATAYAIWIALWINGQAAQARQTKAGKDGK